METARIGVVDYGGGNLQNVLNALRFLGTEGRLVKCPGEFEGLDQVIFPGVGAFGDSMTQIDRRDLRAPILDWLEADKPFFAICVGYQVLFEESEESPGSRGLGFFKGPVVRFPSGSGLKVPHMGWNTVRVSDQSDPIWAGLPPAPHLYFVHSYYPKPDSSRIVAATTEYGVEFAAAARQGSLFACQFHPERSQSAGLRLLKNFLEVSKVPLAAG